MASSIICYSKSRIISYEQKLFIKRSLIFRILYFVNILLEIHYAEYKSMKDLVEKYYGLPGGSLVEA